MSSYTFHSNNTNTSTTTNDDKKKIKDRPLCLLNLDLKSSCSMQGMREWQRWDKVIALQVRISLRSWLLRCQIPNQDQHVPCPSTKLFVFSHHHALFATF